MRLRERSFNPLHAYPDSGAELAECTVFGEIAYADAQNVVNLRPFGGCLYHSAAGKRIFLTVRVKIGSLNAMYHQTFLDFMKFTTPVGLPPKAFDIVPESRLAFFGSCFAERIALRMKQSGFRATSNPMGTLYNPASIALAVAACLRGEVCEEWLYEGVEGLWHSRLHSTAFSAPSREECLRMVENSIAQGKEMLARADALIVTFGTADVFEHSGMVVANCHRQPARQFLHRRLTIDEIVEQWKALLTEIWSSRSNLKVVMTVSPYRYAGLGMHESTLSKSVLHLAIEQLQQWDRRIAYFPAYEIVLDELRDYRFYAPDMLHVSEQASDYVWQQFVAWSFAPEAVEHMEEWNRICKDLLHRPLRPQSDEYAKFRQRAEQRCADFARKWGIDPAEAMPSVK